jgi:ABC-type lipoprotein export system ATPase subunit/CRP-like cAMP-binding protein
MPTHPIQPAQGGVDKSPFVHMRDIVKTFETSAGAFTALKGITVAFHQGEFVSVVGRSGSGKSTLVNMLSGIDHPTSGQVRIGDVYVHELNESQMARWRGRNLGIVFQFYQLLPMLSLLENVILPMDLSGLCPSARREGRAMELLDMVGLADVAHQMPVALSGGQQQSAAVARALANDPPLIVADEPTGNLDSRSAERVFQVFEELVAQGKTIVMVTHDGGLAGRAGRTLLLADGEVINETVAHTLPLLSYPQMLQATRRAAPRRFAPGETILRQGEPNSSFYMIASGYADVLLEQPHGSLSLATLGPGEHFGEVTALRRRPWATAKVQAAPHSAVEVLELDREIFGELMAEAGAMRQVLERVVDHRLAQNAATRRAQRRQRRASATLA